MMVLLYLNTAEELSEKKEEIKLKCLMFPTKAIRGEFPDSVLLGIFF
jgi:hypothetical protein